MYKLQTNFFGGDATFIENAGIEFATLDEAVNYLMKNKPPDEFEWNVRLDGKGSTLAWTRYGGEEVSVWKDENVAIMREYENK